MYLERVLCRNFRNFEELMIDLNPNLNIFLGANGQGKTNFLESIYLMATANSHRSSITSEMINWDQEKALVQLLLRRREGKIKLAMRLEKSGRQVEINDNPLDKVKELLGYLNAVLFSPEDLKLVKEGPSHRREFIDLEISQVSRYYNHLLNKYDHLLKQRNNLLKSIRDGKSTDREMLSVWDEQLAAVGSKIILKRIEVVDKLKILARLSQRKITEGRENLELEYDISLNNFSKKLGEAELREVFIDALISKRDQEISRGYTVVGPHRDDLILKVNDMDLRKYGSQGQQRTAALSLKLAELEFMKSETGEYPVLLLDDVFSELDGLRRKALINIIADKIQTIITATDGENLSGIKNNSYNVYQVKKGRIKKRVN
ncbi:DNA replication/repair protein RecF [Halanaerobium saccharolyticum]|jgi:DNA replication and repair protein RecF|uniref:DNA replication and repair protein RecF n=1 Tax=Halanaerobium saccharolyticum TaxID=43595 RepID=A0A2T5RI95_9FIRM|nr:DNA replication/repair protein RecF [Halanaerobium saccharolyticum]PTV97903.1 DNA replication and repair protein RecF [Halanaerobium saccharolyticum]TDP96015.1 DNA replication and repair protein RecF [Halanaerobium saccharolyticum]